MLLKDCVLVEARQIYPFEGGLMTKTELIDKMAKDAKVIVFVGRVLDDSIAQSGC